MPFKTGIRLLGVARNPANGFPARLLVGPLVSMPPEELGGRAGVAVPPGGRAPNVTAGQLRLDPLNLKIHVLALRFPH